MTSAASQGWSTTWAVSNVTSVTSAPRRSRFTVSMDGDVLAGDEGRVGGGASIMPRDLGTGGSIGAKNMMVVARGRAGGGWRRGGRITELAEAKLEASGRAAWSCVEAEGSGVGSSLEPFTSALGFGGRLSDGKPRRVIVLLVANIIDGWFQLGSGAQGGWFAGTSCWFWVPAAAAVAAAAALLL